MIGVQVHSRFCVCHTPMGISHRELVVAACMLAALLPVSAAKAYELVIVTTPTAQPLVAPSCKVEICCVGFGAIGPSAQSMEMHVPVSSVTTAPGSE